MISFVTLLIGLVSGSYPIEVRVSQPVAAVELSLDGEPAGRLTGSPWKFHIDLGTALRPHELVARALDVDGREIARASQWLNLPRPHAEMEIVLEHGDDGVPKKAVLTWQSVHGANPSSIRVTLDGERLNVDQRGRAELPRRDLKSLHILTSELRFPAGVVTRKDVAFGGEYGSEISTELTAVPVRVPSGGSLPPPAGLQGWFMAGGVSVAVAAVEEGLGRVVVVRVPSENEIANQLVPPRRREILRRRMQLGSDDRVRFLSLRPKRSANAGVPSELFDVTLDFTHEDGGIYWLLSNVRPPDGSRDKALRIADAVAVAGLQAARDNQRRAVVLVLGREVQDSSRYDPARVRAYLDSIRVPLFVWSLHGLRSKMAQAWGEVADVSALAKLEDAVEKLRAELGSQRIVWVEGRHLPEAIALSPRASIELVGASR